MPRHLHKLDLAYPRMQWTLYGRKLVWWVGHLETTCLHLMPLCLIIPVLQAATFSPTRTSNNNNVSKRVNKSVSIRKSQMVDVASQLASVSALEESFSDDMPDLVIALAEKFEKMEWFEEWRKKWSVVKSNIVQNCGILKYFQSLLSSVSDYWGRMFFKRMPSTPTPGEKENPIPIL